MPRPLHSRDENEIAEFMKSDVIFGAALGGYLFSDIVSVPAVTALLKAQAEPAFAVMIIFAGSIVLGVMIGLIVSLIASSEPPDDGR